MSEQRATREPIILAAGEGELLQTQVQRLIKARDAQTGGKLSFTVVTFNEPFAGPPLHLHERNDECFFILEGEFTFRIGGRTVDLGSGGFVYVPTDTPLAFLGRTPGRMLGIFAPGEFESYFDVVASVVRGEIHRDAITRAQTEHGMVVLGPPLGEQ
jgi:mannose-6-phosphate isomerase-like protein (cupin superfamily)